jgi:hypothetical protein
VTSRARGHIGLRTKLAAAIAQLLKIPYEHQCLMSEEQVLSLVDWHHDPIPHGPPFNGCDSFFNLDAIAIMAHRKETAEKTVPTIARIKKGLTKREQKAQERAAQLQKNMNNLWETVQADVLNKDIKYPSTKPKFKWPKGRKIQSRGFQKKVKA